MWQPTGGIVMNNGIGDTNPEETVACIALSKNDSYVMSASGGKVSLFNMMTFKVREFYGLPKDQLLFIISDNMYNFSFDTLVCLGIHSLKYYL